MKFPLIIFFVLFIFNGCQEKVIFVEPSYPKISSPREVPYIKGAFLRKGCLWINEENTNLCDENYLIVSKIINDLRTNDVTFRKNIKSYNDFVEKEKEKEK